MSFCNVIFSATRINVLLPKRFLSQEMCYLLSQEDNSCHYKLFLPYDENTCNMQTTPIIRMSQEEAPGHNKLEKGWPICFHTMAQLNITSFFNLAPFLRHVVFVMFKLFNAVLKQLLSIYIAHAFHHDWKT